MKPQLLSGARGQLKVNGKVLAMVTDVSIDAPASVRAIHTFGALHARSVEPLQAGPCSVSIGRVIPMNDSKGAAVDYSAIASGLESTISAMLTADDIEIELFDKLSQKSYAVVKNCRFAGRSVSVSAGNLASERISLMGIYDSASNNTVDGTIGLT